MKIELEKLVKSREIPNKDKSDIIFLAFSNREKEVFKMFIKDLRLLKSKLDVNKDMYSIKLLNIAIDGYQQRLIEILEDIDKK